MPREYGFGSLCTHGGYVASTGAYQRLLPRLAGLQRQGEPGQRNELAALGGSGISVLPGRHPVLAAKQLASSDMPAHVKKRAAAICTRMIHAKFENFVNPGNRSNIKMLLRTPASALA